MAAAKKKVLVVGTGSIGERHTRCILATNRAEVSICEINDNLRKKIADNYNIKIAMPILHWPSKQDLTLL